MLLVSCGSDEPKSSSEDNEIENVTPDNDVPSGPQVDNEGEEEKPDDNNIDEDPEPPAGNESKYFIPSEEDFMGRWQAYWQKKEIYWAKGGKWEKTDTEILEGNANSSWGWAYKIAFLNDKYGQFRLIWGDAVSRLEDIVLALQNGEETTIANVVLDGGLFMANYYKCEWYENAGNDVSMIVLKDHKNTVQYRWKVSQFDGDTFTVTPAHYDFPSYKEGTMTIFNSYKFKKI